MKTIKYKAGYKYQLVDTYYVPSGVCPDKDVYTKWVVLHADGMLFISGGYAWDGPSGPAVDTNSFMRGSLVHDALYQLIREDLLPIKFRKQADQALRQICREDGMSRFRARYVYWAVRLFAKRAVTMKKPIMEAP